MIKAGCKTSPGALLLAALIRVGRTSLDSRVDAVGGGEHEAVVDERAAAEPAARQHQEGHPRPLVEVGVLPAHDAKDGAASPTLCRPR